MSLPCLNLLSCGSAVPFCPVLHCAVLQGVTKLNSDLLGGLHHVAEMTEFSYDCIIFAPMFYFHGNRPSAACEVLKHSLNCNLLLLQWRKLSLHW